MRVELHGLTFETPRVTFYLWTPWRASFLEHRLFEAICRAIDEEPESGPEELFAHIDDQRAWRSAHSAIVRVMKGWQEEAAAGSERRHWRWLIEADTDPHGYDSYGEAVSLWLFLQVGIERGGIGEGEKPETFDLEGFGIRIWGKS